MATMRFMLVDPNADEPIISQSETTQSITLPMSEIWFESLEYCARPRPRWLPDGEYALVEYRVCSDADWRSDETDRRSFRLFDREGNIIERDYLDSRTIFMSQSLSGDVAYRVYQSQSFTVDNLLTGDSQRYEFRESDNIRYFRWNPDGDAAFILTHPDGCYDFDCVGDIWLWEQRNGSIIHIYDNAAPYLMPTTQEVWSPDGAYLNFESGEGDRFIYDVEANSIDQIDIPRHDAFVSVNWESATQLSMATVDLGNSLTIYTYDFPSQTVTLLWNDTFDYAYYPGELSPELRYYAQIEYGLVVIDRQTGDRIHLRPDGRSWLSIGFGEVYWSEDGEWLITAENAVTSSGGGSLWQWTGVAKRDGSVNRDLSYCQTCIYWLPEQVDVDRLPSGQATSVLPEPDDVIQGDDWSFFLSWSPEGQQIVRGPGIDGGGDYVVLDVESGTTVQNLADLADNETFEWIENADGTYSPSATTRLRNVPDLGQWTYAVSPNGRYATVKFEDVDNPVLYDVEAEARIMQIEANIYTVAAFSPDSRLLIIAGPFNRFQLWDVETRSLITTLNTNATALAFSPDGQTLAVASSWDIQLWDMDTLLEGES